MLKKRKSPKTHSRTPKYKGVSLNSSFGQPLGSNSDFHIRDASVLRCGIVRSRHLAIGHDGFVFVRSTFDTDGDRIAPGKRLFERFVEKLILDA
jgi:hypothetical protein